MKKVLIIQGFSSVIDIINDAYRRNLVPTILLPINDIPTQFLDHTIKLLSTYSKDIRIIKHKGSYEQLLKLLKKEKFDELYYYSEVSVRTATRLSTDLHLRGNPYSKVQNFLEKEYMHKALKEHGIRYIRGETAKNLDEIIKIYHKFGDRPVVIKPSRGGGSVTIKFCKNLEDIKQKTKGFFTETNMITGKCNTEALVQEWIHGQEYIVNTQVIDGKSFVAALAK